MRPRSLIARAFSWPIVLSFVAAACGGAPAVAPTTAPTAAPTINYPTQPITLIIPWAAGGDTDVPMRVVADFVSKELNQPIVIQNVAGAGGSTGTRQFKNTAKPDGYTLLSIHEHTIINQHTGVTDYSPLDFEPIALMVTSPAYLATHVDNPWKSLSELIDDAKKRPNEITMGMTFGSTTQMFGFLMMHKTGAKFRPVGYEGTAQRVTALLGKQIHLGETPLSTAQQHLKAGTIRVLGYAGDQRDPRLPDVKTFKEQGLDIVWGTSRGWVAPKGTPKEIIKKVEAAIERALKNPELKKKIEEEQGSVVTYLSSEKYVEKLKQQDPELKKVIQETGMKSTP
jgi:tripartite-type tricarboxylate transporter receptor subunit TctC